MGSCSTSSASIREPRSEAGWTLAVYPEAGEAGGSFRYAGRPSARSQRGRGDPERSRLVAARRARGKLRRYCAANRLNRKATLTYAPPGCHDPGAFRQHIADFFRELRDQLGGKPFPYAWVPEWHKSGHGLHGHFAVGRWIHWQTVRDVWGRGHVWISPPPTDLPVGSGVVEEARIAGRYLAKYIGKDFANHTKGLHRYDVAEGFQPRVERATGPTLVAALDSASEIMGGQLPAYVWQSGEEEDWQGPPSVWALWRG